MTADIGKRAAGESIVHRRRRANDFRNRSTSSGRERTANHGHDAGACRHAVAPRARDRDREMTNAGGRLRFDDRRRVQAISAQDGQSRRGIPSGQLRVQRLAVGGADLQSVLASKRAHCRQHNMIRVDDAARRTPASVDLNDRGRNRRNGVGELI